MAVVRQAFDALAMMWAVRVSPYPSNPEVAMDMEALIVPIVVGVATK
jgi:hypothetical protein